MPERGGVTVFIVGRTYINSKGHVKKISITRGLSGNRVRNKMHRSTQEILFNPINRYVKLERGERCQRLLDNHSFGVD